MVNYEDLTKECRALLGEERDALVNSANFAAFVYHNLPQINWSGFYFLDGSELALGPFQGKPACTRIALGKGVCGTAFQLRRTLLVDDVHTFEGHIACDPASRSEIVIPIAMLVKSSNPPESQPVGVFDIDAPVPGRFTQADKAGIETLVQVFESCTDMRPLFPAERSSAILHH